ncbi:hypothetical protein GCM10022204_21560 [Microlunatus aurantiacus]|uniref:DUF2510 domain-containing protein n=1 Tax=Microlunatus aurantiacus TaxID=446786 RepID=A0ABP7DG28_9ACTN
MSTPGWYPDPGGQPGAFRYWDGSGWTNQLTSQPGGTPSPAPSSGAPGPAASSAGPTWSPAPGAAGSGPGAAYAAAPRRSSRRWLIGLIAVAVALVVVVALVVRGLGGVLGGVPGLPGGDPSSNACPQPEANSSPTPQPADGRVHSGPLSYPQLPAPWEQPLPNTQVPFGRDVLQQFVQTEQTPKIRWGAAVMVGELVAGDGFFEPKDGAEIVLKCVTGTFYGDAEVTRNDTRSQAMTVDGHEAWIMESDLSFSIPGLEATNELLTVVIVDLENGSAGLFASSVPGNSPQYNAPAKQAMQGLRVS